MVVGFLITLALVGAALISQSPWARDKLTELRGRLSPIAPQLNVPSRQPVDSAPLRSPTGSTIAPATRCLINGEWFIAESGKCLHTPQPASPPATRSAPSPSPSAVQNDPFMTPGTIYLCRTYSDGRYWSNAHCRRDNALIERIVSVPVGMPFEQQVELGKAAERQGAGLMNGSQQVGPPRTPQQARSGSTNECRALAARINNLDALARQPQSATNQDRIRAERNTVRSRQLALNCR